MAWGSTHIYVDTADGINEENSLFFFNDYNEDDKGFETKQVPLAKESFVNSYDYILDTQKLFDQITLLGRLYQSDTEKLFESKKEREKRESKEGGINETTLITQEDLKHYLLSKNKNSRQGYFLILSKALKDDADSVPALLRLAESGKIPFLNDLMLIEQLEEIEATAENITAIAKLKLSAQKLAIEKISAIDGTTENILAIKKLDWGVQRLAIDKIPSINGTDENILAIKKLDWGARKLAKKKMSAYHRLKYLMKHGF